MAATLRGPAKLNKVTVLIVTAVATVIGVAVYFASHAAAWTSIPSSYATNSSTPQFFGCTVKQTSTQITLKIRAQRPNTSVVSQSITWYANADYTGASGNAFSDTWTGGSFGKNSIVKFTLPKSSYMTISYQTNSAGYGYTQTAHPPTNLPAC